MHLNTVESGDLMPFDKKAPLVEVVLQLGSYRYDNHMLSDEIVRLGEAVS